MHTILALIVTVALFSPLPILAQKGRALLEDAANAMGAATLKSIEYTGGG